MEGTVAANKLFDHAAKIISPPPTRLPHQWADENRVLPLGSAEPGQFRSARTPYMIPILNAVSNPIYRYVCAVCGSQMGKTDNLLNAAGWKLDDDPAPILYVGPTQSNIQKVIEPRVMSLIRSAKSLSEKFSVGKKSSKTQKMIAGVKFRMAWAGSATELASDPACLAFIDELDRMERDVKGEGDPFDLVDARISTYADGKLVVTSTPTIGLVNEEHDPKTGLTRWTPNAPEEIHSAIWKLWQSGTRFEWAVPCSKCHEYFIPRFSLLWWKKGSTAQEVLTTAKLRCPHCDHKNPNHKKDLMNAEGVFVAPGQRIDKNGKVFGPVPTSDTASYWVSGLMSPWRSYGQSAKKWLDAVHSGAPERIQVVLNTVFGELYKVKGEAPPWESVKDLRLPYKAMTVPEGVRVITAAVDVQKDRLIYEVRGWGYSMESWQIMHGEFHGETEFDQVWDELAALLKLQFEDKPITLMVVDSGYRPGDKFKRPDNQIYKFCRRFNTWARASKGHDTQDKPIKSSVIDITLGGRLLKNGLTLWHLNTDYFKSWVHARIVWPEGQPGGWHLNEDTTEDYCRQLVAEARVTKASGRFTWLRTRKENHYLDCAALNVAAAHMLNLHMLRAPELQKTSVPDQGRPEAGSSAKVVGAPAQKQEAASGAPSRPTRRIIRSTYMRKQ